MTQIKSKKLIYLRQRRIFSLTIRKNTVKDIELGKCTVIQACKELGVNSRTVYRWIYLYSRHLIKNQVMVVEDKSESYRSQELEKRIKDLEAALGRKQIELELLNKIIDLANEEYKTDLKKNLSKHPLKYSEAKKGLNTKSR